MLLPAPKKPTSNFHLLRNSTKLLYESHAYSNSKKSLQLSSMMFFRADVLATSLNLKLFLGVCQIQHLRLLLPCVSDMTISFFPSFSLRQVICLLRFWVASPFIIRLNRLPARPQSLLMTLWLALRGPSLTCKNRNEGLHSMCASSMKSVTISIIIWRM